ncbi:MAG: hypothetical protein HPY87_10335 [Fervidobacterium sp.]|uniref:hypothetical protein n=1 Tax=Fervidobacterium sp. TaxID=1871331 RepID=UPI0025BA5AF4|nr:hypothetical protein [Fervidobacterium sp.]NPU90255.1 hypothetical protein [Fervidobacterium sp.]
MKMLYEDSPRKFEELLATLLKTDTNIIVGPTFTQQTKTVKSIPDLAITQKSFSVFFETKTTDWFYEDQIYRHIAGFNQTADDKILFLLSNFENDNLEEQFGKEIQKAKKHKIILQPLTFEDFVGSLEQVCNSEYLRNLLDEFKLYLDRNGRLPKWKYLLDVVSCSGTLAEIEQGVYMCPDTGGAYSHRRAKYFGPYSSKKVADIFEINAIVVIEKNLGEAKIKWKNKNIKDETLIEQARQKLQNWQWRIDENKSVPLQVFLLDNRQKTNFVKETSGGMLQSKKYFWDIATDCKNSQELAEKLRDKNWGDYE